MPEINKDRLVNQFMEMVKISSESLNEENFGTYCKNFLENEIGCEIYEDDSKSKIGGNQSNIIAKYYGNSMKKAIMFAAHLDTVKPGENIVPVIEGSKIISSSNTILGADDKAGIASLFEALLLIKENEIDAPDIDIVLTVGEEIGLMGAKHLDYSYLRAKEAYALDSEEVEKICVQAPSQNSVDIEILGIEAHAGMCPEKGISAVKTAAEAIVNMPLGRIDSHTTTNMGVIKGGLATNIVTKRVEIKGEVRSHSEDKLEFYTDKIREAVYTACSNNRLTLPDGSVKTAICTVNVNREYNSMHIKPGESVLERAEQVYRKLGIPYKTFAGGGGSDANVFNEHGIKTIILGIGMMNVHTVNEYIEMDDLALTTKIILGLIEEASK